MKTTPKPHLPYRSLAPWEGFTPREKKRPTPLPVCPHAGCRRAKACLKAMDDLYCQRTHLNSGEIRKARKARAAARKTTHRMPAKDSPRRIEALRILTDHMLEEIQAKNAEMTERWKNGEFDHLYGKYNRQGVMMHPPEKVYVDLR
jgi:hypothetical protein